MTRTTQAFTRMTRTDAVQHLDARDDTDHHRVQRTEVAIIAGTRERKNLRVYPASWEYGPGF